MRLATFEFEVNYRQNPRQAGSPSLLYKMKLSPRVDSFGNVELLSGRRQTLRWVDFVGFNLIPAGAKFRIHQFIVTHVRPRADEVLYTQTMASLDLDDTQTISQRRQVDAEMFAGGDLIQPTLPQSSDQIDINSIDSWAVIETDNPCVRINVSVEFLDVGQSLGSNGIGSFFSNLWSGLKTTAASVLDSVSAIGEEVAPLFSADSGITVKVGSYITGISETAKLAASMIHGSTVRPTSSDIMSRLHKRSQNLEQYLTVQLQVPDIPNIIVTGVALPGISIHLSILQAANDWNSMRDLTAWNAPAMDLVREAYYAAAVTLNRAATIKLGSVSPYYTMI